MIAAASTSGAVAAELVAAVVLFTGMILLLVLVIMAARAWLVPRGEVTLVINGERRHAASAGRRLLEVLSELGVAMPAACGGRGTCGQCRLVVTAGAGPPLPVEAGLLGRRDLDAGVRLACQVTLREDVAVEVPAEILGVHRYVCRVVSNRNVATLMKELVLEMPPGEALAFRAGVYVQMSCPPHRTPFSTFDVEEAYREEWDRLDLWRLVASSDRPQTRAYSLASPPAESTRPTFIVRIATPPPGAADDVPPGVVSSWLFARRPGDPVEIAGPYGTFCASDSGREMILVGGGAGMAPLRSIVLDQLERVRTERSISFWYGARNVRELFHADEFDRLAAAHPNFRWTAAISEPREDTPWTGPVGFVHEVLSERYLAQHPAPAECEYYLCGPPMMIQATRRLLAGLGVDPDAIRFDDFGS